MWGKSKGANSIMLTAETQEKYLKILRKGNTLKIEPSDAIEMAGKFEDLEKVDQIGRSTRCVIFKENLTSCKEKIIMKFFVLWANNEKQILYWCPCSIQDIVTLAGATEYDPETNTYKKLNWVPRHQQLSFLGKDIKKACAGVSGNKLIDQFVEKYVNTDHPIADNIFYTIYIKTSDDRNEQSINCARNVDLSPRPNKKNKES